MTIIGWVSAGITSVVACKLALKKYKKVKLFYLHINTHHKDNFRFIRDCEKWYGQEIIVRQHKKYKTQFDVFRDKGWIKNRGGAPCTMSLKKELRFQIEKEVEWTSQVFGYEYDKKQIQRAENFALEYEYTNPLFPLIETKLNKNDCAKILELNKIEIPEMYKMGFLNNNCIGCVKGGLNYWIKIRKYFPEEFEEMCQVEEELNFQVFKKYKLSELPKQAKGGQQPPVTGDCGIFCTPEIFDI